MHRCKGSLVIIDDDHLFCDSVASFLNDSSCEVIACYSGTEGLQQCKKKKADVIILDQQLPDATGMDLCRQLLECNEQAKIIFITAFPSFKHAVQALRNGAYDYLSKPFELEELEVTVKRAFRTVELEHLEELQQYRNSQESSKNVLIGRHRGLDKVDHLIDLASVNTVPVLITGETGTGKNVVAKAIHYRQKQARGAFVSINCAALPESLIESEFFGHEKGSFTGAVSQKKGLFEMACGGTLFLDEIGELPMHLQSKLLGVLDDGRFRRIGGQSDLVATVRIIAATNVNLEEAIAKKQFREDLYYRMSVMHLHLPPLRERTDDIEDLCLHFLASAAPDQQINLLPEELHALIGYSWPGNVRELKNIIERAVILRNDHNIHPSMLLAADTSVHSTTQVVSENDVHKALSSLADVEKYHIVRTLESVGYNHTQAARSLGIARSTLLRKIQHYGIQSGVAK